MDYLANNKAYWERGYHAPNVDHAAFRFYGRILKQPPFSLTGEGGERLLEFGCGQGAAANYYAALGFDVRGVDISEVDISVAKTRFPHIAYRFSVCHANPADNTHYGWADDVAVVTAFQSLYYFGDSDFAVAMDKIYSSMRKGAVFFATMMSPLMKEFWDNSKPAHDGLREVAFRNSRLNVTGYFMRFIKDQDELKRTFKMFRPVHVGHYGEQFRSDEAPGHHWTFCGVKD